MLGGKNWFIYLFMQHSQGLCSVAPGYNMCIVRSDSVSNSFVMVISDQIAQESCLCALCFDLAGSICGAFRGEQCLQHLLYNHVPPISMYSCWTTSAIWTWSHCKPAGSWVDLSMDCCTCCVQYISDVSLLLEVVCGTFPHLKTKFWIAV